MITDPYQQFLRSLYSYRVIILIVFVVSAINGVATLFVSFRIIKTFVKDIFVFIDGLFYTKKKFKREGSKLAEDIKVFLQKKQMELPIVNTATDEGLAENIVQNEKLRQTIRIQFFSDFRDRLVSIRAKARKYDFELPSVEKALNDPPNSNPALIRNELSDILGTISEPKRHDQ